MTITYGFTIINDPGTVIVDEFYKNYHYYAKGSTACSSGWNTISIPNTTRNCIVGIRPVNTYYTYYGGLARSGSTYTDFRVHMTGGATIYWIIYREGETTTPTANDYGVLVKNATGDIMWSSLDANMEVVDIYPISSFVTDTSTLPPTGTTDQTVVSVDDNYFVHLSTTMISRIRFTCITTCPSSKNITNDYVKAWSGGVRRMSDTSIRLACINQIRNIDSPWNVDDCWDCGGAPAGGGTIDFGGSAAESSSGAYLLEVKDTP